MSEPLILDIIGALDCRATSKQEQHLVDVLEQHRLCLSVSARIKELEEDVARYRRSCEYMQEQLARKEGRIKRLEIVRALAKKETK